MPLYRRTTNLATPHPDYTIQYSLAVVLVEREDFSWLCQITLLIKAFKRSAQGHKSASNGAGGLRLKSQDTEPSKNLFL
jgi:hypothetical protein